MQNPHIIIHYSNTFNIVIHEAGRSASLDQIFGCWYMLSHFSNIIVLMPAMPACDDVGEYLINYDALQ